MAPHSSTLAWKIPRTEEPGGLQSMGSLRVGPNWVTFLSLFTFVRWRRKWQPTPVFLPGESLGWGSLVGCLLWGRTTLCANYIFFKKKKKEKIETLGATAAAAARSLQSCPTLCDSTDGSPPGSPVPGILQARTLEWVAFPFSNAWKWKVKMKSLSLVWLLAIPWTAAYQAPPSMGFFRQEYWSGVPLPSPILFI